MAEKKGVIKRFFSPLVDVRKWSDFDDVVDNAKFVTRSVKDLCNPQQEVNMQAANFEELKQRLHLTEEDIKKRTKYFLYYSLVYFFSALCLFFYMGYLIAVSGRILSVLATMILAVLMLVYAVREHLWYVQLKKRKLGCGFKDWIAFLLGRAK